jgi:hypothetical protein
MKIFILCGTFFILFFFVFTLSTGAMTCDANGLRISEVQFDPNEGGSAFIEIENKGAAIDIRGLTLVTVAGAVTVPQELAEPMTAEDRLLIRFDGGGGADLAFAGDHQATLKAPLASSPGNPAGYAALFRTVSGRDREGLLDYIAWGAVPPPEPATTAVAAMKWPAAEYFFPSNVAEILIGPAVPVATGVPKGGSLGRGSDGAWRRFLPAEITPGVSNPLNAESTEGAFPPDGESMIETPARLFWTQAPGAASYAFQLSAGEDFSAPIVDTVVANAEYLPTAALTPSAYRWRVQSIDAMGNRALFSPARSFTIKPVPVDEGVEEIPAGTATPKVPKADPPATGGLSGKVLDSRSGNPLDGVLVSVGGQNATTNAAGVFSLAGLPVGQLAMQITLANYTSRNLRVTVSSGATSAVTLTVTGKLAEIGVDVFGARKETTMLSVSRGPAGQQLPRTGSMRWDIPLKRATHARTDLESWWCWGVSARMINRFYKGSITNDEVIWKVKKDLAYAGYAGANEADCINALTYALGGAPQKSVTKPTPANIKGWIDGNMPLYFAFGWKDGAGGHVVTIAGYRYQDNGLYIKLLNWDNNGAIHWQSWATLDGNAYLFILRPPATVAARAADKGLETDKDRDGINDFDEGTRFPSYYTDHGSGGSTSIAKADSDEDRVEDKSEIASWTFRTPLVPPDIDNDKTYPEADKDSDNGGIEDGDEDLNFDGIIDPPPAGATAANTETDILLKSDDKLVDLAIVIDTTGSMGSYINNVKANAVAITNRLEEKFKSYRVSVVQYRDHPPEDSLAYGVASAFTTNKSSVISAVNSLGASGGGDWPESLFTALVNTVEGVGLADGEGLKWRSNKDANVKRAIVYMTDAPGHSPDLVTGYTSSDVVVALLRGGVSFGDPTSGARLTRSARATESNRVGPVQVFPLIVSRDSEALSQALDIAAGAAGTVITPSSASTVSEEILAIINNISTSPSAVLELSGTVDGRLTGQTAIAADLSRSSDPDGCGISLYELDWDGDGTYDTSSTQPLFQKSFPAGFRGSARARVTTVSGKTAITAFLEAASGALPVLSGPPQAISQDRQTGLLRQTIVLGSDTITDSYRILVQGLPAGAELYNRSGVTDAGIPFIQVDDGIIAGGTRVIVLEYFVPALAFPAVTFVIESGAPLPAEEPTTGGAFNVDRIINQGAGVGVLLEFTSEPGKRYGVQYSNDSINWKLAGAPFTAGGNRVQWRDYGPPKTPSVPGSGSRFYRVVRY